MRVSAGAERERDRRRIPSNLDFCNMHLLSAMQREKERERERETEDFRQRSSLRVACDS